MSIPALPKGKGVASSNWLVLQKQLDADKKSSSSLGTHRKNHNHNHEEQRSRKRRKLENGGHAQRSSVSPSSSRASRSVEPVSGSMHPESHERVKGGESRAALRQMVFGHMEYTESHKLPGKYLALDCEMVGVGIEGVESSLARVSLVNFYGVVIMDEFVRQKERVVDYRTQWSGIRESDMVKAKPFEEVQKEVADLLKERILIGHAVHNDLKALLLSHPRPHTRDSQYYAHKFGLCKTNRIALRNLVKQELDLTIQSGEHSSVTDARATMAVYRLHKKEWEKGSRPLPVSSKHSTTVSSPFAPAQAQPTIPSKRKKDGVALNSDSDSESDSDTGSEVGSSPKLVANPAEKTKTRAEPKPKPKSTTYPGGGKKGVSSGLSTVVHRAGDSMKTTSKGTKGADARGGHVKEKTEWWKQLPGGVYAGAGAKGSIRVAVKR